MNPRYIKRAVCRIRPSLKQLFEDSQTMKTAIFDFQTRGAIN